MAQRNAALAGGGVTSAPKDAPGPGDTPGYHNAVPAGVATSPAKGARGLRAPPRYGSEAAWRNDPTFISKGTSRAGLRSGADATGLHAGRRHDFASERCMPLGN